MNVQPHKPPDPPAPVPCQQDILSGCIMGSLSLRSERSMPRRVCVDRVYTYVGPEVKYSDFKVYCTRCAH